MGESGVSNLVAQFQVLAQKLVQQLAELKGVFSGTKDIYSNLIAIDLDVSSILFLQLTAGLGRPKVSFAKYLPLPQGVYQADNIVENQSVETLLSGFIGEHAKIGNKQVAIAIPGSKALIKKIKLDFPLEEAQIEKYAWDEAKKAFPGLKNKLMLDYSVTNHRNPHTGGAEQVLYIVIARKEDVMSRVMALDNAGFETKVVDIDYYACARAYRSLILPQIEKKISEKSIAVINFNPSSMLLVVMMGKKLIYHNRNTYEGDYLYDLIQAIFNPDSQSKEESVALTDENIEHIGTHMRRLLQFYYAEHAGKRISQVVLSGRCALLESLIEPLSKQLSLPVNVINPFRELKLNESKIGEEIYVFGPAYLLACGLAMRGIPGWT